MDAPIYGVTINSYYSKFFNEKQLRFKSHLFGKEKKIGRLVSLPWGIFISIFLILESDFSTMKKLQTQSIIHTHTRHTHAHGEEKEKYSENHIDDLIRNRPSITRTIRSQCVYQNEKKMNEERDKTSCRKRNHLACTTWVYQPGHTISNLIRSNVKNPVENFKIRKEKRQAIFGLFPI